MTLLSRRELVAGFAAGTLTPLNPCRAAEKSPEFAPEMFGASGDGIADDYGSFQRLAAAVNAAGGGTLMLRPSANYFLDRYVAAGNGIKDVLFRGCSGLVVQGNGATIAVKGDYFRDAQATRGLAGLRFEDCTNLEVHNLQLVGNVQQTRRAKGVTELPSHGLIFAGCSDVIVDGVRAHHFAADGLYIGEATTTDSAGRYRASRRFKVRNSQFLFNARQGMSIIQLRDALFDRCEFSYTGYIDRRSTEGRYGHHAPSAGVDIEPDYTPTSPRPVDVLTGNIMLRNCRMIGNLGATLIACEMNGGLAAVENVTVNDCTLETSEASTSQYGLIFDVPGSAMVGNVVKMRNKTAYLGWSAQSRASPKFVRNTVSGHGAGPGREVLVVIRTRGSPIVEANRFIDLAQTRAPPNSQAQFVRIENPNARLRDNQFMVAR